MDFNAPMIPEQEDEEISDYIPTAPHFILFLKEAMKVLESDPEMHDSLTEIRTLADELHALETVKVRGGIDPKVIDDHHVYSSEEAMNVMDKMNLLIETKPHLKQKIADLAERMLPEDPSLN